MALIFCIITDLMRRYNILSITTKRKVFVIFSHFVPGALLISLYYSGGSSLIVYSLALGFMGAAIVTNVTNIQDMAPNHAAQLYGLVSVFPLLVSVISRFLISDSLMKQDLERAWQLIFIMTGVMFLIGGVVFLILGTGKLQKWNFHRNSFQFSLFNKESHSES
ncbi:sodium-dependent phosphate transport protein 3-like [Periplaneta americana]|uniref:sodium-dependent phosphate transport protein 3-like n=1 Tax=Periplaneta americana TaxID=6978 RepID=UPI0037E8670D